MIGTKDTFLYKLQCGSDTGMISWTYVPISTSGGENHLSIVTSHLQVPCCSTDNSSNTPTSRALFVRLGGVVKSFAQKKTNNINLIYLMESFTPQKITPESLPQKKTPFTLVRSLNQFGIVQLLYPRDHTRSTPHQQLTLCAWIITEGSYQEIDGISSSDCCSYTGPYGELGWYLLFGGVVFLSSCHI